MCKFHYSKIGTSVLLRGDVLDGALGERFWLYTNFSGRRYAKLK